jgi:hypothetical protein
MGVNSLLSPTITLRLLGGYGGSFYESGANFSSFIGHAELSYRIFPTARLSVGAKRDFADSTFTNYFEANGGFLGYDQVFLGRLFLMSRIDCFQRKYASDHIVEIDPDTGVASSRDSEERKDIWIESSILLEYRMNMWLSFYVSSRLWADITDYYTEFSYDDLEGNTHVDRIEASFFKFEALGGIRVSY